MVLSYLIVISLLVVAHTETSYPKVQNRVPAGNEFESTANKTSGINTVTKTVTTYSGMRDAHTNHEKEINGGPISENSSSKGLNLNPSQILLQISETISNDIKLYTTATNVIMFLGQMIDNFLSRNIVKKRNLATPILPEERESTNDNTLVQGVRNDIYNTAILTCLVREARVTAQKTHTGECILLLLCKSPAVLAPRNPISKDVFRRKCACVACVVIKAITDQESRRITARNQKLSMEWGLLTNVTWSREGNAFANITYGGYTLVVFLLLIKKIIDSTARPSTTEKVLLAVGFLFFIAIGGLVLASLEQIPYDLFDNAIILGSLSLFIALLFLVDLADPQAKYASNFVQTEEISGATQNLSEMHISSRSNVELNTMQSQLYNLKTNGSYSFDEKVNKAQPKVETTVHSAAYANILTPEKFRSQIVEAKKRRKLTTVYNGKNNYDRSAAEETYRKFPGVDMETGSTYDVNNLNKSNQQGFVVRAARMWEKRQAMPNHFPKIV